MSVHFHALKVAEIVPETAEANSIRFEIPPELRDQFAFKAGQHLTLRATIDGEEVRRNYSLCTAPDDQDWMVTVKRIVGGLFSNWVGDRLKPGDMLDVMPPHGSFTTEFDVSKSRHIVGIAGGSGITPVLSLIKTTLKYEPNSRFTLLYGNRDSSSIIFLEELANLKDRYLGRLSLHHFLAEEEGDIDLFNGMAAKGKKLSYTAYIVRAAAEAMAVAPAINGRWEKDRIAISPTIDIGVGTALGEKGLVVPVVKDAGSLSLEQTGAKLDELTRRARDGKLERSDVSGGSFTISNHGTGTRCCSASSELSLPVSY